MTTIKQFIEQSDEKFRKIFYQPLELPNGDISHYPNLKGSQLAKDFLNFLLSSQKDLLEMVIKEAESVEKKDIGNHFGGCNDLCHNCGENAGRQAVIDILQAFKG